MEVMQQGHSFTSQFNLYRLPNEMWIAIFEAMGEPSDLLKVIKTCKHFYALAVRVLYRNLQWISPIPFASNTRFWWNQTLAMSDVPTSLVVGISHINSNSFARFDPTSAVVEVDGSWNVTPPHPGHATITSMYQHSMHSPSNESPSDWRRYSFFASKELYDTLSRMISTFSMLQELVFHQAELPETIYPAIKSLPRLRHLAIQYCSLPVVHDEPDVTFADLPITSLTLWCSKSDSDQSPTSNYVYALHLCTARNLRTLRVDWTTVTARFFALTTPHIRAVLPIGIEDLTLRMPVSKLWPSEGDASRTMLIVPLVKFLRSSPSIRRLSVFNRLPSLELDAAILPNLNMYIGPLTTVVNVLKDRPVEHLEISDVDKKLTDFINLLPEVAKIKPDLKTLCLVMREWDNEILHAIYQLFTDLRKIRIKYEDKYPSEYTLLSLGAQFLHRFPLMECLQLYQPNSSTPTNPQSHADLSPPDMSNVTNDHRDQGPGAADDEDVKELIIPWQRHCKYLKEVQFVEGVVWRRAYDGDEWCKRRLPSFDRYRELMSCL